MAEPSDDHEKSAPRVGELKFSSEFEPNTLVYDANTASPPQLIQSAIVKGAPGPKSPVEAVGLERVAHFRVLGTIGKGGMGVVYRASDEYLQRLVALKVLTIGTDDAAAVENTQRLLREARAASRISHPNVVTVFAAGEADGHPFIAMEYVEGKELGKILGSSGLDTARALDIAAQIAEGLGAAHQQGIVHRDIKPANILVCAGDRVKILDFGLAKPGRASDQPVPLRTIEDLPDSTDALDFYNTQQGVIWGSLRYMSPEQFTGDAVDARSDVFSLGVVLYQTLTGTLPFFAKSPREQLAALLRSEPPPLQQFNLRIPGSVQTIVDRALARNRDFRYATGDAMAADLRTALRRLVEFGDSEIEDTAHGARNIARQAPSRVSETPEGSTTRPNELSYSPDSVTFFPAGSQFDVVIVSPHVYPWAPRGVRLPGATASASGTVLDIEGETFEVVAADQQRSNLNRYFLSRLPAHSIIRRIVEYTPELVAEFASADRSKAHGPKKGPTLSSLFGRRGRDA